MLPLQLIEEYKLQFTETEGSLVTRVSDIIHQVGMWGALEISLTPRGLIISPRCRPALQCSRRSPPECIMRKRRCPPERITCIILLVESHHRPLVTKGTAYRRAQLSRGIKLSKTPVTTKRT